MSAGDLLPKSRVAPRRPLFGKQVAEVLGVGRDADETVDHAASKTIGNVGHRIENTGEQ
jgi:hypothetical protein